MAVFRSEAGGAIDATMNAQLACLAADGSIRAG
jgi:hypothetical protein